MVEDQKSLERSADLRDAKGIEGFVRQHLGALGNLRKNALRKILSIAKNIEARRSQSSSLDPLDVGEQAMAAMDVQMGEEDLERIAPLLEQLEGVDSLSDPRALAIIRRFVSSSGGRDVAKGILKRAPMRNEGAPVGRNAPCPCGCGKKFKNCPNRKRE